MNTVEYFKKLTNTKKGDILLIEPCSAGDVYQTLCLVDHLREERNPNKINLICQNKGLAAAKLFNNIDNACTFFNFDYEKIQLIANSSWYTQQKNLFICHPSFLNLSSKNGKEFMQRRKEILGIDPNKRPTQPKFNKKIFDHSIASAKKQGLQKNSILIFNHSFTLKPIPSQVFEPIAKKYPGRVYYDRWSNGVIKGATPIDIELEEVPYFANIAGTVITMRSGIMELASSSTAKIFTIYPDTDYCNDWTPPNEKIFFMDFTKSCKISDFDLNPDAIEIPIYIENNESIESIQEKIIKSVNI